MKILFVGNHLHNAGYNISVSSEIANRLCRNGFETIITSSKGNKLIRLLDMLATIFHYRMEYQAAQVDVFSGQAFIWASISVWALKFFRKPLILTLHGGNLPAFAQRHPAIIRLILCSANLVTVPSNYLYEAMLPYRHDLTIIPNPLDIQSYPFVKRDHPYPKLIWLRAFHEIYNPEMAPRVLAALLTTFPETQLLMVGPDKKDGSLQRTRQIAEALDVVNNIRFHGIVPKEEVPEWLSKGDIFLNTTNVDNTPVSVLEAMACGLCVVSTNVGGIPYLSKDEEDALLVPPNDPERMATAVRRILTEPGLSARLSENARKKAEQSDWSVILPQWDKLFHEIVDNYTKLPPMA